MRRLKGEDWRGPAALALCLAASAGLYACATPTDLAKRSKIEPNSPIAMAIAETQAQSLPAPTWADIPKTPKDVRPAASWTQSAAGLKSSAGELTAAAAQPAETPDPDALAKRLKATSGLDSITAPGPGSAAELEAYARELRERATPPPPPQ